jgi:tetratricopeptide (TPR) repeat protein
MKKGYIYLMLIFSFLVFTVLIIRYRKPDVKYQVMMRTGALSNGTEWSNSRSAIESLIEKVNSDPSDIKAKRQLGMAYIQEARISGNHSYYDKASLDLFDDVLKKNPGDYEALVGKATVLLSQHHFSDAIPVARQAEDAARNSSAVYGLLTDAYVELGDYKNATFMADSMSLARPDMRSYSRISYLREIFGNYDGAVSAMKMAVEAGYPGLEQTEWCRVQLGHLYENMGNLREADLCYEQSLYYRPDFPWAYAGKGRIEKARHNYAASLEWLSKAMAILPDFSFQQEMTSLYRIMNRQEEAAASAQRTIALLAGVKGDESAKNHGHYADKELAYAYLDAYDYVNAYKHALIEYNRRPDNIDINQMMAWVNYKLGKYDEANKYIDKALSTHSKNPELNYRAGLIKIKSGNIAEGNALINNSIKLNPFLPDNLKWEKRELISMK